MDMSNEVAIQQKSLADIFKEHKTSDAQEMYLSLVARGATPAIAGHLTGMKYQTVQHWLDREDFQKLAVFVGDSRDVYREEAQRLFFSNLSVKAQHILELLIDKGIADWDKLDKMDKTCVMQALNIIGKHTLTDVTAQGRGSYEELILRRKVSA